MLVDYGCGYPGHAKLIVGRLYADCGKMLEDIHFEISSFVRHRYMWSWKTSVRIVKFQYWPTDPVDNGIRSIPIPLGRDLLAFSSNVTLAKRM